VRRKGWVDTKGVGDRMRGWGGLGGGGGGREEVRNGGGGWVAGLGLWKLEGRCWGVDVRKGWGCRCDKLGAARGVLFEWVM
jgi:hypothetical protein